MPPKKPMKAIQGNRSALSSGNMRPNELRMVRERQEVDTSPIPQADIERTGAKKGWMPLEEAFADTADVWQYHIDTRDFTVARSVEPADFDRGIDARKVYKEPFRYLLTWERLLEILMNWREKSGGTKPVWRAFYLKDVHRSRHEWHYGIWSMKFVNVYRLQVQISDEIGDRFIITNKDNFIFDVDALAAPIAGGRALDFVEKEPEQGEPETPTVFDPS